MPWWAWIVLGVFLLGAELTLIDAQFYLVFIGAAALIVGALGLGGIALPDWLQWLTFAALSVVSMMLFRQKVYELVRRHAGHVDVGPAGEHVVVPCDLPAGESCRVEFRGSTWTARNVGDHAIAAESQARIVNVDGLTLQIKPVKHAS